VYELGQELSLLASMMPASFWVTEPFVGSKDKMKMLQWQGKALSQMAYYQTHIALYLPYLLKPADNMAQQQLSSVCMEGARSFLGVYHQFRHPSNTSGLKCRPIDSVACTATVILLLGLWGHVQINIDPLNTKRDWESVQISMETLRRTSTEKDGKVALQSSRALQQLM
jgi:hypothetical protein